MEPLVVQQLLPRPFPVRPGPDRARHGGKRWRPAGQGIPLIAGPSRKRNRPPGNFCNKENHGLDKENPKPNKDRGGLNQENRKPNKERGGLDQENDEAEEEKGGLDQENRKPNKERAGLKK